jgi:hypothetical protein
MTIVCILYLAALIGGIVSALGKCPVWVPVLILAIAGLLGCLPLR